MPFQNGGPTITGRVGRRSASGTIDVTDVYSTDAEIVHYGLRVLRDDREYFAEYQAVLLYREEFVRAHPRLHAQLERLAGKLAQRVNLGRLVVRGEEVVEPVDPVGVAEVIQAVVGHGRAPGGQAGAHAVSQASAARGAGADDGTV